ncbi:MAG TPA: cysteine desulfurase [Methanomassiliicoccales archaeon]|jgi:cysteine desulfurase/selenocysteine lyase|nr:cysteine desulfurase [Methanomassiliicoccales archaeon]
MDANTLRKDFPVLERHPEYVYLDNACQTFRPRQVIEAMNEYYLDYPACGGRSVHRLATQVSIKVDEAREKVARFLGAHRPEDVVFTKNCTEAINLVAKGLRLRKGDEVLTTDFEHNSNLTPWQQLELSVGIKRGFVPSSEEGVFSTEEFKKRMSRSVKVVSMVQTNNVTGTSIPAREVAEIAHDHGALVLLDGAQSAPHGKVDVRAIDADFFAFSGHKMLGPSGIGALCGRTELLKRLEPLVTGGGSVATSTFEKAEMLEPPDRFEGGLQNYPGIIGMGAAVDYLSSVGMEEVAAHDLELNRYATKELADVPGLMLVGPKEPEMRGSIFCFNLPGMSSHDIAMILDDAASVMVRSGMHCAHPFFIWRHLNGGARASFYLYNTIADCKKFADAVKGISSAFAT